MKNIFERLVFSDDSAHIITWETTLTIPLKITDLTNEKNNGFIKPTYMLNTKDFLSQKAFPDIGK